MNLSDMTAIVRRDLHDEEEAKYRWADTELERHITHAVKDFSEAVPLEQKVALATTPGSREIDISSLAGVVMVEAVEYPAGLFPKRYQRFSLWAGVLTVLGDAVPDGRDAGIYYGKLHSLTDESSTIPPKYEDLIATGAAGYAALEFAAYTANQVNVGGNSAQSRFLAFGREKLTQFKDELRRLGRKHRVRAREFYTPYYLPVSKTTDAGP